MSGRAKHRKDVEAWTRYWKSSDPASTGCLPGLPREVSGKFEEVWRDFFAGLPEGGAVLDLGTGSGAVLQIARSVARQLKLTGVDYSSFLPSLGDGICMMSDVRLEQLPFSDSSFDAVCSQFALEYADQAAAVAELERVLAPEGALLIIAHHADSVIVAHNNRRLSVLKDMTAKGGLLDQAKTLIRRGRQFDRSGHVHLSGLLHDLRQHYPEQGVVNDIAGVMARILAQTNPLRPLRILRAELTYEIGRLTALRSAALTEAQARALADRIADARAVTLSALDVPGEPTPLAWCIASSA